MSDGDKRAQAKARHERRLAAVSDRVYIDGKAYKAGDPLPPLPPHLEREAQRLADSVARRLLKERNDPVQEP